MHAVFILHAFESDRWLYGAGRRSLSVFLRSRFPQCGVRLIRTNLHEDDVRPVQEELTQSLFNHIPVGVGSKGVIPTRAQDLTEALEMGMDWSLREGYAWAEDKERQ